jgi:hypothetical protein
VRSSLPASQQLILEAVEETADGIVFRVRGKHTPRCPSCFESRVSYHSRYMRRMRDLPWQGKRVEIHLQARRFRCRNNTCDRKIFAESLPELAGPKARETTRLCEIVGLVGYALGGLPGERLLHRLGIVRSDDTVLRRVKSRGRGTSQPKVRVLGVDDWAWRKRQRYGTMLMDPERLHVIDLLPVRSVESFAHWLGLHPEVEVITRDRSGLYADGGRHGAPSAVHYLRQEPLRREIHEGLNVIENWNSANNFILYGKGGEFASNKLEDQEILMLSLHLLQVSLVYVNTLMIQEVLKEGEWPSIITLKPAIRYQFKTGQRDWPKT